MLGGMASLSTDIHSSAFLGDCVFCVIVIGCCCDIVLNLRTHMEEDMEAAFVRNWN